MTRAEPGTHLRRSLRLRGYDYTQPGAYFVTVSTHNRECVLGEVVDGRVVLSPFGQVADECWQDLPSHFPGVLLDQFTVMPNHVHGILVLVGATHASPLHVDSCVSPLRVGLRASPLPVGSPARGPRPGSVGAVVGSFKSATTRRVNRILNTPGAPFWQRNFHEHVVRDEEDLDGIRAYILHNPLRWELDENHPARA